MFFDSREPDTFTPELQRELVLYANLITMAVAHELSTVRSILSTIQMSWHFTQLRDVETARHMQHIGELARIIAHELAEELELSDEYIEHIYLYSPMHDIGKIGIPDRILLKPGKLNEEEWEIMKTHTTLGREMIDTITADLRISGLPAEDVLRNIVELHHEAMDGSGYPYGLAGANIPLEARITSVADVYDSLTADRAYKSSWTVNDAIAELEAMALDGKLDPVCVAGLRRGLAKNPLA